MLRTFGSPPGRTTCCEKNNRKTVRVGWRQTCPSSTQRWCPLKMLVRILLVWGGNGHCSVWSEVLGDQQRPSPQVGFLTRCRGAWAGREPQKKACGVWHLSGGSVHVSSSLSPHAVSAGGHRKDKGWRQLVLHNNCYFGEKRKKKWKKNHHYNKTSPSFSLIKPLLITSWCCSCATPVRLGQIHLWNASKRMAWWGGEEKRV